MARREFTTEVIADDRGRVYIVLPFDPSAEWGRRRRHYVRGDINDEPFEGSLGVRAGRHFMPLNKELRGRIGVEPGNTVAVRMEGVEEASETAVPPELAEALAADPGVQEFFEGLSPFYRNQYAEWVARAKRADTRAARVKETVELLRQGRRQR